MKEIYINRELSWLKFNKRVLEEAVSLDNPLFERLRFLSIFSSNLDEFYMVRVGSLFDQSLLKGTFTDNKTGMTIKEQLEAVYKETAELIPKHSSVFKGLMEEFAQKGVWHLKPENLEDRDKDYLKGYFDRELMPLLSPQIIDNKHPFPHLINKQIYMGVYLLNHENRMFGIIPINSYLEPLVLLPTISGLRYMQVEDIIYMFANRIFKGYEIMDKVIFRITRNADIEAEEAFYEEDVDYREVMKELLKKRSKLAPVRLELSKKPEGEFDKYLRERLNLSAKQVFITDSPMAYGYIYKIEDKLREQKQTRFFYDNLTPLPCKYLNSEDSVINQALKHDIFFTYPYESTAPIIRLVKEAATDKSVVSIKITLYRVGNESKIINALIEAADNGKDVVAVLELKARFDEANNINWSNKLEEAGCKVVYGLERYKVHSKIMLITRKQSKQTQYITHVASGNYNEKTAKLYTDVNLITANNQIGEDAMRFFNNLTIANISDSYRRLLVSPFGIKNEFIRLIDQEIKCYKEKGIGKIIMKLNSLTDKDIIDKLAEASTVGVKIELIVRGICCLKAGVPGKTNNIKIISIVSRFLEHSRIYYFHNCGNELIYISSADLMTRNTEKRVEIACPILDENIKKDIMTALTLSLRDNIKARVMHSDGNYYFKPSYKEQITNSQLTLYELTNENAHSNGQSPSRKKAETELARSGLFSIINKIKNRLWN